MDFLSIVNQILTEESMAGEAESVFGSNVGNTSSHFSGDNYAAGDARSIYGGYSGVLTRRGMRKKPKKRRKGRKKRKT